MMVVEVIVVGGGGGGNVMKRCLELKKNTPPLVGHVTAKSLHNLISTCATKKRTLPHLHPRGGSHMNYGVDTSIEQLYINIKQAKSIKSIAL